jgi:hypothetical protein
MINAVGEGFTPSPSWTSVQAAQGQASDPAKDGAGAAAVAASQNPAVAAQAAQVQVQANSQQIQAAISQATGKGLKVNAVV